MANSQQNFNSNQLALGKSSQTGVRNCTHITVESVAGDNEAAEMLRLEHQSSRNTNHHPHGSKPNSAVVNTRATMSN